VKNRYQCFDAGEPDKTWTEGFYFRLDEAKGLLSKGIKKDYLAMSGDPPEVHTHRCRFCDEEDYEWPKITELVLRNVEWGMRLGWFIHSF
jgi:hypothetical protein